VTWRRFIKWAGFRRADIFRNLKGEEEPQKPVCTEFLTILIELHLKDNYILHSHENPERFELKGTFNVVFPAAKQ
jgi:hypothetical protein